MGETGIGWEPVIEESFDGCSFRVGRRFGDQSDETAWLGWLEMWDRMEVGM